MDSNTEESWDPELRTPSSTQIEWIASFLKFLQKNI